MGFVRSIGGPELLIILVIVLVLFGSTRLPGLARSLGDSARELRRGLEKGEAADETEDAAT
jgi:sec-independent protein translocase protein TatA